MLSSGFIGHGAADGGGDGNGIVLTSGFVEQASHDFFGSPAGDTAGGIGAGGIP